MNLYNNVIYVDNGSLIISKRHDVGLLTDVCSEAVGVQYQ